jgi:transcriptional regulator GlxA family with amidase domain
MRLFSQDNVVSPGECVDDAWLDAAKNTHGHSELRYEQISSMTGFSTVLRMCRTFECQEKMSLSKDRYVT